MSTFWTCTKLPSSLKWYKMTSPILTTLPQWDIWVITPPGCVGAKFHLNWDFSIFCRDGAISPSRAHQNFPTKKKRTSRVVSNPFYDAYDTLLVYKQLTHDHVPIACDDKQWVVVLSIHTTLDHAVSTNMSAPRNQHSPTVAHFVWWCCIAPTLMCTHFCVVVKSANSTLCAQKHILPY